jgi:parallel beta-helix repeat protein
MAKYPNQIYEPREKENRPGVTYDPNKKTVLFAEDIKALDDEVKAIETELGTNPKGNFDSVKAFLQYLLGKVKDYFTDLLDVPHSYEGQAGKVLKVKQTEDGLEFGEAGGGGKRTATRIVAASDSLDKTGADYVCDGTADQEEINQAINDLPTFGGRVLLLEGTYNISSPITILKNNVTLEGQGAGTKLFLVNGANCDVIRVGNGGTALQGVKIANLKIDGNKNNQSSSCYGIFFYGYSGGLITQSSVENCIINNFNYYGIVLAFSNNNIIIRNQLSLNFVGAIYLSEACYNTITGNQVNSNGGIGIYLNSSRNNTITGNQVNSNFSQGIYIVNSHYNTITGNQVNSNYSQGIYLSAAFDNIVTENYIKSNNSDGIRLESADSNIIIGNRCQGNSGYGINIYDSASDNNLVVKNYLTGNTAGSLNDNGTGTIKGASTENDNVI